MGFFSFEPGRRAPSANLEPSKLLAFVSRRQDDESRLQVSDAKTPNLGTRIGWSRSKTKCAEDGIGYAADPEIRVLGR